MSKKIRILSLLLSASMLVSVLCACTTVSGNNSSNSSVDENADPNSDGNLQLNEPGEFPLVLGDTPGKLSIFTPYQSDQNSKFDAASNSTTAYVEDLLNVEIDWTIVSTADKIAKLNLLFQSKSYEDIIFGTFWDSATQYSYGSQGYLLPLNDYIENDSVHYQNFMNATIEEGINEEIHWDSLMMPDGNIYTMGTGNGGSHQNYNMRMWVFEPWLETLNLEVPTTTDEFYDMLVAMRDGDPNGNGKKDEIPLAGSTNGWNANPFTFLANSFVYYSNIGYYYAEEGEVKISYVQDEFKDALNYYHSLVADGLMMPDTFTQDQVTLKALTTSDLDKRIVGVTPAGGYNTFTNFTNREAGEWADWISIAPLQGPDGVQYAHQSLLYPVVKIHLTNNCEYPKLAFRFCDALYQEEVSVNLYLGAENTGWRYVEEGEEIVGEKGGTPNFCEVDVDKSVTNYKWDSIITTVFPTWEWGVTGDPNLNQGVLLYRTAAEHEKYAPSSDMILPPLIFNEKDADRVVDIKTVAETYLAEAIAKFAVFGGVDEGWDAYLQYMKDCGIEELQELYQIAYEERMSVLKK